MGVTSTSWHQRNLLVFERRLHRSTVDGALIVLWCLPGWIPAGSGLHGFVDLPRQQEGAQGRPGVPSNHCGRHLGVTAVHFCGLHRKVLKPPRWQGCTAERLVCTRELVLRAQEK